MFGPSKSQSQLRTTPIRPSDSPTAQQAPPAVAAIDSERTDSRPLTLSAVFGQRTATLGGRTYVRVNAETQPQCGRAASGTFARALTKQKCRYVLRATYVDTQRRYVVTTGIAVLPSKAAAIRADRYKDLSKNVWFRPLAGPAGAGADRIDRSGGYASGVVWGRYIVFSYASYTDGHTPRVGERDLAPVSAAFRDYATAPIEKRARGASSN